MELGSYILNWLLYKLVVPVLLPIVIVAGGEYFMGEQVSKLAIDEVIGLFKSGVYLFLGSSVLLGTFASFTKSVHTILKTRHYLLPICLIGTTMVLFLFSYGMYEIEIMGEQRFYNTCIFAFIGCYITAFFIELKIYRFKKSSQFKV